MEKEETKLQNTIRAELSKIGIVQQNNVVTFLIVYGKTIAIGLPRESYSYRFLQVEVKLYSFR